MEKKCKKAKWLSEVALQIAVKRREVKSKGEKERFKHPNAEFQRIARPRHRGKRNPERPPSNSHGDWPFLRPPDRVPEVPIVSGEHLSQLRKTRRFSPPGEMRPICTEASRG